MAHRIDIDRRTQRTRAALHDALASLVHEKSYDDVVVKEILGRAHVARSTFYAHYRDKTDLLEQSILELLRIGRPSPPSRWSTASGRLLRFSLPFLEHVERWREQGLLAMDACDAATVHDHLRRVLERELALELRAERRRQPLAGDASIPVDLLARHLAASFVLLLDWWLAHPALPARDVDARFRALVETPLRAALGT
jgi:AcrR family transcriptional regulator